MRMHALYSHNSINGAAPKSGIRLNRRSALLSSVFVAAIAVAGSANADPNPYGFLGGYAYGTWPACARRRDDQPGLVDQLGQPNPDPAGA